MASNRHSYASSLLPQNIASVGQEGDGSFSYRSVSRMDTSSGLPSAPIDLMSLRPPTLGDGKGGLGGGDDSNQSMMESLSGETLRNLLDAQDKDLPTVPALYILEQATSFLMAVPARDVMESLRHLLYDNSVFVEESSRSTGYGACSKYTLNCSSFVCQSVMAFEVRLYLGEKQCTLVEFRKVRGGFGVFSHFFRIIRGILLEDSSRFEIGKRVEAILSPKPMPWGYTKVEISRKDLDTFAMAVRAEGEDGRIGANFVLNMLTNGESCQKILSHKGMANAISSALCRSNNCVDTSAKCLVLLVCVHFSENVNSLGPDERMWLISHVGTFLEDAQQKECAHVRRKALLVLRALAANGEQSIQRSVLEREAVKGFLERNAWSSNDPRIRSSCCDLLAFAGVMDAPRMGMV